MKFTGSGVERTQVTLREMFTLHRTAPGGRTEPKLRGTYSSWFQSTVDRSELNVYNASRHLNLTITHLNVNTLHSQIKHKILLDELSIYLKRYYIDTMNNTLNDRFK